MYDLFEAEAKSCLAHRLVIPAHDYVLRCSHTFNLLDARGAIGVTERALFLRPHARPGAAGVDAYVEQREHEEYPWLADTATMETAATRRTPQVADVAPSTSVAVSQPICWRSAPRSCPATTWSTRIGQLKAGVAEAAGRAAAGATARCTCRRTPRRLACWSKALAADAGRRGDRWSRARRPIGPSMQPAQPRPRRSALRGRTACRSRRWRCAQEGGGRYVYAVVRHEGRPTLEVLPEALPGLVAGIKFGKTMRWNASERRLLAADPLVRVAAGRHGRAVRLRRADCRAARPAGRAPRARPSWKSPAPTRICR